MLRDFLNRIYDENLDMGAIADAAQPELDALNDALYKVFTDAFVETASEDGILRWETILGITPAPAVETLAFRRGRVRGRLANSTPYTERALQAVMDNIMGVGGWSYALDYRNYSLTATSMKPGRLWLKEMETVLGNMVPANLIYALELYNQTWQAVYEDSPDWQDVYDSYGNWQDVLEGIRIGEV